MRKEGRVERRSRENREERGERCRTDDGNERKTLHATADNF